MSDGPATNPKFILSLPQNVLESLPGGTPPPGMQALSPNPATLRPQTIAVGSVFLVIATIFFAIRVYVKAVLIRRIGLDDYVCTAAFVSCAAYTCRVCRLMSGKGILNRSICWHNAGSDSRRCRSTQLGLDSRAVDIISELHLGMDDYSLCYTGLGSRQADLPHPILPALLAAPLGPRCMLVCWKRV